MGDETPQTSSSAQRGGGPALPLATLLEVQDHDTAIDQLVHRRETLPERAELRSIESRLSALDERTKLVRIERDELGSRQSGLEQQIESSKARRGELQKRMFGGQVTAPRELQAMDDEVKHLARHISDLEDRELELMEVLEPLDATLGNAETERVALEEDAARLREQVARSEVSLDSDLSAQRAEREGAAAGVPADLLGRYEQLRKRLGGTGAARLVGSSCSGCHLTLPSMEVDRIRKASPDTVITCDQCGRILVR
ncbi:MAG TPA: C4-type zinc ribbon domain-containing protein [Acidimicrobiales bacterium]|nr:C4-type zinc ribbon domain-containing protein [Acidimicrobiales bacterium]